MIYQIQYQEALKKQINGILDTLNGDQFSTISEYLAKSYESGFVGAMYDIHGQGVPLIFPIDQDQVVQAVTLDTKLSKPLYNKLGENVNLLKKRVANNISRGIAQGQSYSDIAKNIAVGMVGNYARMNGGALYNAMRITRTEAHRISQQAAYDALKKAKDNGADVVKQWDATLDKRTRPSHARVDGEIRELDEPFSNGLMKPGDPRGRAAEVINCRCQLLQRARWALDDGELQTLKDRAEYFGLDKTDNFEKFKEKYLKSAETLNNIASEIDITDDGKYKILDINKKNDYEKYIRPEYYAQRMTWKDNSVLWSEESGYIQNSDGYDAINKYMRGINQTLDVKYINTLEVLNKRTSNKALRHDYIGYRKVDCGYLDNVMGINTNGLTKMSWQKTNLGGSVRLPIPKDSSAAQSIVDSINSIVNTPQAKITDKAVTSISMCEKVNYFTHRPIQFEIQMPKETKGLITNNYDESEFIAKAGSSLEILGAEVYNDGEKDCVRIFAKLIQE